MVKSDFEKSSPKLGNIEIEITDSIRRLQRILLDLLQKSLLDIKKSGNRIFLTQQDNLHVCDCRTVRGSMIRCWYGKIFGRVIDNMERTWTMDKRTGWTRLGCSKPGFQYLHQNRSLIGCQSYPTYWSWAYWKPFSAPPVDNQLQIWRNSNN